MFDFPDNSPFRSMYCKPLSTKELLSVADAAGKLGVKLKSQPMKKENVKVKIRSQAEASAIKILLDAIGEATDKYFFGVYTDNMHLVMDSKAKEWILVNPTHSLLSVKQDVDLKELLALLSVKTNSMLTGKCAIQVNNEREFRLLMEHYHEKGWASEDASSLLSCLNAYPYPIIIKYSGTPTHGTVEIPEHKIIPFSDFAAEVGIKVPVFVMKSEDEVDLYEGDKYWCPQLKNWAPVDGWRDNPREFILKAGAENNSMNMHFSTKEAAKAWIKEQNKPKEVDVKLDYSGSTAKVQCNTISFYHSEEPRYCLIGKELEQIYSAYKSLQP